MMCSPTIVLCYGCFMPIDKRLENSTKCPTCNEFVCSHCGICACKLSSESKRVLLAMMGTYEHVLNALKEWLVFENFVGVADRLTKYYVTAEHKILVSGVLKDSEKFVLEKFSG